jgi:hypothetical protein
MGRSGAEQRTFTRVGPAMPVEVRPASGGVRRGALRDVSVAGLYVEMPTEGVSPGLCRATVELDGENVRIDLQGRIVRVESGGIAIEITCLDDIASHEHLLNLVRFNSHDAGQVERELPGRKGARMRETGPRINGSEV